MIFVYSMQNGKYAIEFLFMGRGEGEPDTKFPILANTPYYI
jgi:hypothetical protein